MHTPTQGEGVLSVYAGDCSVSIGFPNFRRKLQERAFARSCNQPSSCQKPRIVRRRRRRIESNLFFPAACTAGKILLAERASQRRRRKEQSKALPSAGLCPVRRPRGELVKERAMRATAICRDSPSRPGKTPGSGRKTFFYFAACISVRMSRSLTSGRISRTRSAMSRAARAGSSSAASSSTPAKKLSDVQSTAPGQP